jgi:hypothetical protein
LVTSARYLIMMSSRPPWPHTGTELASLREEDGGGWEDEEEGEGGDAVWGMGTGLLGPARKFQPGVILWGADGMIVAD